MLKAERDAQRAEQRGAATDDVTAVTPDTADRFAQRRADALAAMAETTLRHGAGPLPAGERYQVVVHVSAETLAADVDGRCELDGGPSLGPDKARRIACDSSLTRIATGPAGNPLDISRKSRAVPPALRRALAASDGGFRFPGCTNHHWITVWQSRGCCELVARPRIEPGLERSATRSIAFEFDHECPRISIQ